ncbi:MAG: hypothetical protein KDB07_03670, partial [Planctomycetes bacterium]|nr:hypothetical protein [Planctomycetota bacterium]
VPARKPKEAGRLHFAGELVNSEGGFDQNSLEYLMLSHRSMELKGKLLEISIGPNMSGAWGMFLFDESMLREDPHTAKFLDLASKRADFIRDWLSKGSWEVVLAHNLSLMHSNEIYSGFIRRRDGRFLGIDLVEAGLSSAMLIAGNDISRLKTAYGNIDTSEYVAALRRAETKAQQGQRGVWAEARVVPE